MKRLNYKKYLLLGALLFLLMSLPLTLIEKMRGATFCILQGTLQTVSWVSAGKLNEAETLESENHLLRIEIGKLRALLEQQERVAILKQELASYTPGTLRYEQIGFLNELEQCAIPAKVLYRDPGSWASSLWINVGEETNKKLGKVFVAKNSPVIVGRSVVGVIDYVNTKQARVRLITDVALKPSVRTTRGYPQNTFLLEHIDPILSQLKTRCDLPLNSQEKTILYSNLEKLRGKLVQATQGHYLAKGILQGAGTPLWRSGNHTLRGIGFNYDFADEEGPARELATGQLIPLGGESDAGGNWEPLLQVEDLLVTSGIDGVFPPGLRVAIVKKVFPLNEGAYTYEIEAIPAVGNLDTLQHVFIIPPLGFEHEEV